MATTTNYGWTTPDDTALVKDGAAAIRTLGSSVDTTTKALNPSTTLGDIEYRSSTANTNTRLGIGTTGQALIVSGGVPAWGTPAGGGKVLQVVAATDTGVTYNSTTTFADTGLTVTITPTLASSKILVLANIGTCGKAASANISMLMRLVRGATSILDMGDANASTSTTSRANMSQSIAFLDSPATTSATTYKVQFASSTAAQDVGYNIFNVNDTTTSSIVVLEIGA